MIDSIETEDWVLQELVRAGHDLPRLQRALGLLPSAWADTWLLKLQGKHQREIAAIMGWTQPGTSYILRRVQRALQLLMALPDITEESIEADLAPYLEPRLVEVLRAYYRTCNFTRTAELIGYSGSPTNVNTAIKALIKRALRTLAKVQEAQPYCTFFEAALANPWAWGHNKRGNWTQAERREAEAAETVRAFEASRIRRHDHEAVR